MSGVAQRSLRLVTAIPELRDWVRGRRAAGERIALVPTMGALHEGHLALVDEARRRAERVVMSLFVNPLQFGPTEDLARYPRDPEGDRALAAGRGVDLLFAPEAAAMYPPESEVRVIPGPTAERWEGAARPGHFAGVLTVVAKLFHLVEPDVACFGRKDIQQAVLIRQMVRDLDWPLDLVVVPTVRERDGLALSSRNRYLTTEERHDALGLSRALGAAHQAWRAGERRTERIAVRMQEVLAMFPRIRPEYIAITDSGTLSPVETVDGGTVIALAAWVGGTRLIDNIILGEGLV